ncbi:MAG: 50S ribosomal protein L23 [Elusimicrobiota bacterium]|nr:50S ribosomal protein L23 [Elusimicrobiota bacterium]
MFDPYQIIKGPVITEKSTTLRGDENKYTLFVSLRASKTEIKRAVEELFKVEVIKVNTFNLGGKKKRLGIHEGHRARRKKAVVTLKPGNTIRMFEGA